LALAGGDEITFDLCLDCGQIQDEWPAKSIKQLEGKEIQVDPEINRFAKNFVQECYDTDMADLRGLALKLLDTENPVIIGVTLKLLSEKYGKQHAIPLVDLIHEWDGMKEVYKIVPFLKDGYYDDDDI
jgi:hypothetical protein